MDILLLFRKRLSESPKGRLFPASLPPSERNPPMRKQLTENNLILRFSVLQPVYWSIMATFCSYVSAFGLEKGYSQSTVSRLVAVYMMCAFIGQFIWGSICDRLRCNKWIFMLVVAGSWLSCLGIYFAPNIGVYAVCYGLLGFLLGPAGSNLDSWLLKSLRYDGSIYSRARAFGSMGYAIAIALMGKLIQQLGYWVMPVCCLIMTVLTLGLASSIPDAPREEASAAKRISFKDIIALSKNRPYMFMLLLLLLLGLSNAPVSSLKIMLLQNVGGDVSWQGIDSGIGCVLQFVCFILAGKLSRFDSEKQLRLFVCLPVLTIILDLLATSPAMIVVGTCVSYGCYSFMLPACRRIVAQKVDHSLQTTANGLVDAVYGSLAGMISLQYAGAVIENWGVQTVLLISMGYMTAVILLVLAQLIKSKKAART